MKENTTKTNINHHLRHFNLFGAEKSKNFPDFVVSFLSVLGFIVVWFAFSFLIPSLRLSWKSSRRGEIMTYQSRSHDADELHFWLFAFHALFWGVSSGRGQRVLDYDSWAIFTLKKLERVSQSNDDDDDDDVEKLLCKNSANKPDIDGWLSTIDIPFLYQSCVRHKSAIHSIIHTRTSLSTYTHHIGQINHSYFVTVILRVGNEQKTSMFMLILLMMMEDEN